VEVLGKKLPFKTNDLCVFCDDQHAVVTAVSFTNDEYREYHMECECGEVYTRTVEELSEIERE
jgi:hypothetical protein